MKVNSSSGFINFDRNICMTLFLDGNINHEIIHSDQGGGEAPAPTLEVNTLHLVLIFNFILYTISTYILYTY